MSPLCIPKLMSFLVLFGSQRSFLRPLTAPLVLPVSPHSSFGPPRVPSQLVWSSPCPLTACLVLSPSQLVWSSPCPLTACLVLPVPLTACLVLPVSPHTLFCPPCVPSHLVWSSPCPLTAHLVLHHSSFGPPRVPSIWLCPPSWVLKDFSVLFRMSFG